MSCFFRIMKICFYKTDFVVNLLVDISAETCKVFIAHPVLLFYSPFDIPPISKLKYWTFRLKNILSCI